MLSGGDGTDNAGDGSGASKVRVAVVEVAIFLPPRFHLLMRFHVSPASTVVRIRTDRWQLLAEMDNFLDGWLAK